jgi:hypothetical protein
MLHASTSLNCEQRAYRAIASLVFTITWLLGGATASGYAQGGTSLSTEKWRPKDGTYASPGKDFESQCGEFGDVVIALPEKTIGGHEWSCKINKLTDTAPGAVTLNMTCNDLNLAAHLKASEDKEFKEVMLLTRINEQSMSVRKTLNGKFEGPTWQADYCPGEAQRMYAEAQAQNRAETEYKIPEQLSRPEQWRPKDGVYASPGSDFRNRCAKSGDVVIGLTEGSIASGKAECKVVGLMNTGQAAVSLDMTCSQPSAKQTPSSAKKGGDTNPRGRVYPQTPSTDVIRMSRIDDNTFHMQKTVDKKFKNDGGPVSYCPEEAQHAYAARKAKQ